MRSPGGMFIATLRPDVVARPRHALVALALLALAFVLRAPGFLASVVDPDEGLYLVQAAAWLEGGWPYVAVWDMHPPGAPALLAMVHALVPDPVLAMRLTGVLAVAATGFGLHALALLLGAGPRTAFAAGALYVAHTTILGGLATNTEILLAPFVALAAWLLLNEADRTPRILPVLGAGLAAGIALWVKQVAALEASALWLTMVVLASAAGRLTIKHSLVLALVFAAGAGLPTLAMAAGYATAGEFDLWMQGNFWSLLAYEDTIGDWPGLRRGVLLALPHLLPLMLAALGLLAAEERAVRRVLPWLGAAVIVVAAPGKFYDHYFLILLPPLSLLAAFGLAALARLTLRARFRRIGFATAVALLAAMPVLDMLLPRLAHGAGLRGADPVRQVATLAASALRPGEALWVANWHPVTYALAGQRPPTRYAFAGHLAGHFAVVTGIDADAEIARILALPPGVIVVAPAFWRETRPAARATIEAALARDYALLGSVIDGTGPVEVWRRR